MKEKNFSKKIWISAWNGSVANFTEVKNYLQIENAIDNQTIRNEIFSTFNGNKVRIKLSNEFGLEDLEIGCVTIFVHGENTIKKFKFNGNHNIKIHKGKYMWSNPINLEIKTLDKIVISIYIKNKINSLTAVKANGKSYTSVQGDFTLIQDLGQTFTSIKDITPFLTSMEILGNEKDGTIIAFGDSISTYSWPDYLAKELHNKKIRNLSVIREAIAGNKILSNSPKEVVGAFGIAGVKRFEQAMLSHNSVKSIIVLEGINDIIHSEPGNFSPSKVATSGDIINGLKHFIYLAHKNSIKIYGVTIMPFKGYPKYTNQGEKVRQEVNHWIRNQSNFDGVFDFDKATKDEKDDLRLNPKCDSGDHLHPSSLGGEIMAKSIYLKVLVEN